MIQSTRIVLLLISSSYSISEFLLQVFPYTQLTINCDFGRLFNPFIKPVICFITTMADETRAVCLALLPWSQAKDEAQRRSILDLVCQEERCMTKLEMWGI